MKKVLKDSVKADLTEYYFKIISNNPIGWFTALLVPLFVFLILKNSGLDDDCSIFVSIVSVSLTMWAFSLLPAFIPPLFAVLLILLFGIVPSDIALSGFASDPFILTISVLGLGAAIISSGLSQRYSLYLIKILPGNSFFYQIALFITGILFTPVVPSIIGRTSISAPINKKILQSVDNETAEKETTKFYTGSLDGVTALTAVFLTGAPANLFVFGLLPAQEQHRFQFLNWITAGIVTGSVIVIGYFLITGLLFGRKRKVIIDRDQIRNEIKLLGPLTPKERYVIYGILFLAIGVFSSVFHKIKIPLICFMVFFIFIFFGIFSAEEFKKKIDWTFVFMLGSVVGIVRTMKHLGIDMILVDNLTWLGDFMKNEIGMFILLLSFVIVVARFFLPIGSTVFIFSSALLPIAHARGISPWFTGFIILLISETSFFNYQSPHILFFRENCGDLSKVNERKVIILRTALLAVKIAAIYISIPYWKYTGVL